jgi:hypothetical protein
LDEIPGYGSTLSGSRSMTHSVDPRHTAPMRTVVAVQRVRATLADAERLWLDPARWHEWVEGLDHVVTVTAGWPEPGATVTWQSGPAGRGRVSERALQRAPLAAHATEVTDDSIRGRQEIVFAARGPELELTLALHYALRRRNPLTAVVDILFVRRAMTDALAHTLERFAIALQATARA